MVGMAVETTALSRPARNVATAAARAIARVPGVGCLIQGIGGGSVGCNLTDT
jgi:hypothetical protein